VNQGGSQTFTASPSSGKEVDQWKIGGSVVQNGGNTYTVSNVQSNTTVQVTFKDIPPPPPPTTYTITASGGSGGSVSPTTATVNQGGSQTFTATPSSGKEVDQWKAGGSVVQNGGNTYTVSNVQSNATVQVTFKDITTVVTHNVTFDPANGSSTWTVTVNDGQRVAKPGDPSRNGYTFKGWYNGTAVFDFNSTITGNLTLTAKWEENVVPQPSSDATLGGLSLGTGITLYPAFNPNVLNYTTSVVNSVTSLTVTASANDGEASVSGTGTYPLNVGENAISVVVTAENGTKRTYTVNVTRADNPDGIEAIDNPDIKVWAGNGILMIQSSKEEQIFIYSIRGTILYQIKKLAGEASFNVSLPKGVLIVRGSSGWARKVINN
jgi:uncharacterized repeat protein (TIGR02543 family)